MARSSPPVRIRMLLKAKSSWVARSLVLYLLGSQPAGAQPESSTVLILTNVWDRELAKQVGEVFQTLPAPVKQYTGLSRAAVERLLREDVNYAQVVREKLDGRW